MTRAALQKNVKHSSPPINEIGLSVVTSAAGVVDPYDISGFHSAYPNMPIVERQPTLAALAVASMVGGASNGYDLTKGPPQKWWFISSDQSRVLQVQEDFFSYNWRRIGVHFGQPFVYPGFSKIFAEFKENLNIAEKWHRSRGTDLPEPAGCELYYEDIVPLRDNIGRKFSLSESLTEFNRAELGRLAMGWSNSWLEKIDGTDDKSTSLLKIDINSLAMLDRDSLEQMPVLRFTWTAGAARSTWTDVIDFFGIAHDHIFHRFRTLISEEVQSTWK